MNLPLNIAIFPLWAGTSIVSRGTKLPELIPCARGPISLRTGETTLEWSEVYLLFAITRINRNTSEEGVMNFQYKYNEPIPPEIRKFKLKDNSMVSLRVRRQPIFRDYLQVIAPAISLLLNAILVYD